LDRHDVAGRATFTQVVMPPGQVPRPSVGAGRSAPSTRRAPSGPPASHSPSRSAGNQRAATWFGPHSS